MVPGWWVGALGSIQLSLSQCLLKVVSTSNRQPKASQVLGFRMWVSLGDALLLTPLCICNPAKLESVMCVSPGLMCPDAGSAGFRLIWPVGTTAGEQRMGGKGGSVETSLLSLAPVVVAPSSQPSSCRTGSCGQFPSRGPWAPVRPPPATAPLASRWSWLLALLISAFSPSHPTFHICCHLGNQFPALNSLSCLFLR